MAEAQKGRQLTPSHLVAAGIVALVIGCCLVGAFSQFAAQSRLQESAAAFRAGKAEADAFYGALDKGDYPLAHSLLGPDLARRYSAEDLRAQWEAFEGADILESDGYVKAPTGQVEGGRVDVVWRFTTSGGHTYEVELRLGKVGDEWKIVGAEPAVIPRR